MGFAVTAKAYDYRARFIQECGWLATQQQSSGGIQEGEDYTTAVESDNTHEAVWIWSRYAELTGDYTTYQTKINNAWTYLNANPAWLEGGSITNYYTTYNCAWGMLAEMKYRQVYQGKAGYVDHTAYGHQCASTLHQGNCGTSGSDGEACILGLAAGALYQYGVFDSNTVAQADANTFGNTVRTWLNGSAANFKAEAWAISGGAAVWGVLNSYYKVNPSGAAAWATNADANMPLNAMNGSNNNYEFGHDGWYAWGHYAASQYLGINSFTKYRNIIDTILASDNDADGGTRQGITYADTSDYAWATDIPQFAANYGLIGTVNYTISGTITSGGSPLAGVKMLGLPGDPCTDANGFYTTSLVPAGFYGTVTPAKVGYSFTPANTTYSNVTSSYTAQNYTATAITPVSIGSWVAGTTHAKETGTNRALLFVAHAKPTSSSSILNTVTYGGKSMTKVVDINAGSSSTYAYVAAFILKESDINSATSTTFTPSWTSAPSSVTYSSVFLKDVNQTTLVGATASNGLTSVVSIATTPLATSNGDMVIENAASSNTGTYLIPTGWTEDNDLSVSGYDGMCGHKNAAGVNETPTITQGTTASTRNHSLIGYVVKAAAVVAPPGKATSPSPSSGATGVSTATGLSWTAGSGATSHDVYFGTAGSPPLVSSSQAGTTYSPGTLLNNTVYNWRIDERNAGGVTTGDAWSFTTIVAPPGKATSPSPSSGATGVSITTGLSWTAGSGATSHDVYFGTAGSPPLVSSSQAGTTYNPGTLLNNTVYNWRIDERNAGGVTTGTAWSFTTIVRRTLTSSTTTGGHVTTPGEGAFQYDNGTNASIVATADAHYHFVNWTGTAVTAGKVNNPNAASTTVQMDADYTVVANFAIDQFAITGSAGANGSISPSGTFNKDYGSSQLFTATANTGYTVDKWQVDGADAQTGGTTYTLSNITATHTVAVSFKMLTYTVTGTAGANGSIAPLSADVNYNGSQLFTATANTGYTVDKWQVDGADAQTGGTTYTLSNITATHTVAVSFKILTYTVTGTAGTNGTVAPSGDTTKDYGSSQLFTATPATGYEVDKWTLDGADAQTGGTTYTLSNITATHTVAVSFKIMTYVVTGTAGANGTVAPSGDTTKDYGSSQLFTATPATGYEVDKWTLDGADAQTGGTTYTLNTITATHTIAVSFKIFTYTVTASTDANGSIDPMGDITKDYGSSQLFTATPTTGYEVDKWTLDGTDIQTGGTTYTLSNITTTHTVAVTFSRIVFSISGYVVEIDGNTPVKDVLMSIGDTNTLTDVNGYYELSADYGWSGVIAPEKEGYVFEPGSNTYNNITQSYNDVNYTATLMTFKIAGYVLDSGNSTPISNVSVSTENGGGPWTSKYGGSSSLTDSGGYYEVWVDYNWSGKVTLAKYAYAFEPNGISYEDVNADFAGQNYAGTLLTFKITGYITNKCNVPISDVLVSADNGGGQAMTDANGFYEVWVSYAWTGTVTLTKKHFTFIPGNGSYVDVLVDQAGQNYTADNIYDLDCDGYIDLGDVKVMCDNWLMTGSETPIPGDFDADGTVDFTDFAIFGNVWGD